MDLDVPGMSVEEFAAARAGGREVAVLDVREPWELSICRLEGAVEVPLGRLPGAVDSLPADRDLVVVCHHGVRSALAVRWLQGLGFDRAVNLDGGIDAWARRVEPEMRRY